MTVMTFQIKIWRKHSILFFIGNLDGIFLLIMIVVDVV
jgi:hypothetical protein